MSGEINLEGWLRAGSLEIDLPDGRTVRLTGKQDGPSARLTLHRGARCGGFSAVERSGSANPLWTGSGFPDLPKVIELAARNLP